MMVEFNKRWYLDFLLALVISEVIWYLIAGDVGILIGIIDGFCLSLGIISIHNLAKRVGRKATNIWMIFLSIDITVLFPAMIIQGFGYDEELQRVSSIIFLFTLIILGLLSVIGITIECHLKNKK